MSKTASQRPAAKIALDVMYETGKTIQIIPAAHLYLPKKTPYGGFACLGFGNPISLENYIDSYKESNNQTAIDVTEKIMHGIEEKIIEMEQKYNLYEEYF